MLLVIDSLARDKYKRGGVKSINGFKIAFPENRIHNGNKDINYKKIYILKKLHIFASAPKDRTLPQTETRNVCITKYARLYKLSNGIIVMTPK